MTVLPLVECEPYGSRLSHAACVRRYELANGNPKGRSGRAREVQRARNTFGLCTGCDVGAARAEGKQVGQVHEAEPRGTPPPAEPPPAVTTQHPPASEPAPSAGSPAPKENHVKTKTCKVVDCANEFEVAKGNRKYCDEHRDPAARKGLEVEGSKKKAAADALNSAVGDSAPPPKKRRPTKRKRAATPAPSEATVSPKDLLELAGFQVREVPTPAGTMLFVEDAAA